MMALGHRNSPKAPDGGIMRGEVYAEAGAGRTRPTASVRRDRVHGVYQHGIPDPRSLMSKPRLWMMFAAFAVTGCARQGPPPRRYVPQARYFTVTAVPLLVPEMQAIYPFLKQDFAEEGVLDDKAVYAFVPGSFTVIEGDTIHFTFVNPELEVHTFMLPDFTMTLPAQQIVQAVYVARRAGLYAIECGVPEHRPIMSGQLVVLSPRAVTEDTAGRPR
jgi:plastocyanin